MFLPLFLTSHAAPGDADLADRLRRRESDALGELYDRYGVAAYSLILRIVRDASTAEDLVQETFLRVWNRIQGFDVARGALGAWLLAVARNRAIDYLRSVAHRERIAFDFDETDHPALYWDMEQHLFNADKTRLVMAAMEKLSANQRTVLELAYFEGLTQSEMAERIGQPLGTIKTWVRTALRILRNELGQAVTP